MHDHQVQFYEQDVFLLDELGELIRGGLAGGQACIRIATAAHRAELETRLRARIASWDAVSRSGRYVALDAAETLAKFMVEGMPEPRRFNEVVTGLLRRATRFGTRKAIAFGEMVALLWADKNYQA